MIPFVVGLFKKINSLEYGMESISIHRAPLASSRRTMNMESHVMCCIFYALRFLVVLDDTTENQICDITKEIHAQKPDLNLFNFRVCYQHLTHRRMLLFKHTMLSRKTQSAQAYTDFI
ncbi:hypothetical protein RvY_05965 [Ramazzottius varieornatus]|uniref:Uncharacterized protein n=1 Tax=Ramazzottius varieornatus TaxID=947166 RepID=A0A1D1V6J9_RAMVA|nr:hypothetical protein RvY_05965 [Ramazzottius varieornatus]